MQFNTYRFLNVSLTSIQYYVVQMLRNVGVWGPEIVWGPQNGKPAPTM